MILEISLFMAIVIVIIAFIAEYADSTLGMGYGTMLTPILLIIGFEPLQVVPAILVSELITGLLAGFTHHSMGNVDFRPKSTNIPHIVKRLREIGIKKGFEKGIPLALKTVMLLAACSIVGTVSAVLIAINLPATIVKGYVGILLVGLGIWILYSINKNHRFSWAKMGGLGALASFNKGISGGGYGPVVTSGQILTGVDTKNAIGITSLAEGLTCAVGVVMYLVTTPQVNFDLAPYLVTGAIISVPVSAHTVKKMKTQNLKKYIGVATILLGLFTLYKLVA